MKWASENVKISYRNPIQVKLQTMFLTLWYNTQDKNGKTLVELIEIKPKGQTIIENAKGRGDKMATTVNALQVTAPQEWCKAKGIHFKVIIKDPNI